MMSYPEIFYIKENTQKNIIWPITLVGVDEAGRGPLAGPVVASSVAFNCESCEHILEIFQALRHHGVEDSKKIKTQKQRREILENLGFDLNELECDKNFKNLHNYFECSGKIVAISPTLIDDINILNASLLAMEKSFKSFKNAFIFIDGHKNPFDSKVLKEQNLVGKREDYSLVLPIIKGDSLSPLIGLASIVAKVVRDHLMEKYARTYPHYGLQKHMGYPTKEHLNAIAHHGICDIHRKTFKGVKEYVW